MGDDGVTFHLPTGWVPPDKNWQNFKRQQQQFNRPSKKDRGMKPNKKR